ncbi:hypothetical protein BZ991_22565 [Salmonella enterica subsp. enterica serovar Enteritidis]|nr:hypothetical protein [Salmonella enterica subsp. enterica serovar Enteritidis]
MGAGRKINCCQGNALARGDNLRCGAVDTVQKVSCYQLISFYLLFCSLSGSKTKTGTNTGTCIFILNK